MSFTSDVKEELARQEGSPSQDLAELSSLIRLCGTLSFHGNGAYSLRLTTETITVARTILRLNLNTVRLKTQLTVRQSVLHKARNFLIEVEPQPGLEDALVRMGILIPGQGLLSGIPEFLVGTPEDKAAYLRGAFLGGGFVAHPQGDFHLEIAVMSEALAQGLVGLCGDLGIMARLNHRRGAWAVYLKSFDDIVRLLVLMGSQTMAMAIENIRVVKSLKNDVNRVVNAEVANQKRASGAAAEQLALIGRIEEAVGLESLPPALRQFCELRRANPELSLTDLGRKASPPLSKSALYHRVVRLERLLREHEGTEGQSRES